MSAWTKVFIWWNLLWALVVFGPAIAMTAVGASERGKDGAEAGAVAGSCCSTALGLTFWPIWLIGVVVALVGMIVCASGSRPAGE